MAASAEDIRKAKEVFATICAMFDSNNYKYSKNEDELRIVTKFNGDDIPMDFIFVVRPENDVVSLLSPMPFNAKEDKRVDMALAVAHANYGLITGTFDFDLSDGEIRFRMTERYTDSTISTEVFDIMLGVANHTVDKYNDKFMMLNNGMIDLEKFMEIVD